jgi:hypothetical protein
MNSFIKIIWLALLLGCAGQNAVFARAQPPHAPRQKFTPEEDARLRMLVEAQGTDSWDVIAQQMEERTGRQCKNRWKIYLAPDVCLTKWTVTDNEKLIEKVKELGPKWSVIAGFFRGRTGVKVRNQWFYLMRHEPWRTHQPDAHFSETTSDASDDTDGGTSATDDAESGTPAAEGV